MFKTNKNSIILAFALFSMISLGVVFYPNNAKAQQYDDGYAHLDFIANPTPVITSLAKASMNGNITIKGFGFIPTSVVRVNGSDHSAKFIDDQHLLINLSQGDIAQSDPLYISVFNGGPGGGYSNASSMKSSEIYNAPVNTNNGNNSNSTYNRNANTNNYNSNNTNTNQNNTNDTPSSLASNAIFGSAGSLVPSGLIGWILFAILILLIIMVVRRLFGFTDAYHASPLKHD